MSANHAKAEFAPCVPGAIPGGPLRTQFFDGMVLTQSDLENTQGYFRLKRRLTNRALGRGVVWGLRLTFDATTRRFALGPGYGVDCCGNDLVVECRYEVPDRTLIELSDPIVKALTGGEGLPTRRCPAPGGAEAQPVKAAVVLQYVECPEQPRPIHRDACTSNVTHCELSRVRETSRLLLVPAPAPEPPRPLELFCEELEELRQSVAGSTVASVLFPAPTAPPPPTDELPLTLDLRAGNTGLSIRIENGNHTGNATLSLDSTTDPLDIAFDLIPNPGFVLYSGKVAEGSTISGPTLAEVTAPLDLRLGWSQVVDPTGGAFTFTVDLGFAQLFSNTTRKRATLTVSGTLTGGTELGYEVRTTFEPDPLVPLPEPSCAELLGAGIFSTDPLNTARSALLAVLYGWLRGLLGEEDVGDRWTGRRLLAAWLYLTAFRLLFGANAAATERAELTTLLGKLFRRWCSGFTYSGPRCSDDHHGIYLGMAEISPNGAISSFDAWDGRRHVLTGALLSHWGAELGLAPLDVMAARLARWLCCVADHSAPDAPELLPEIANLSYSTLEQSVSSELLGHAAALVGGDVSFYFGNSLDLQKVLDSANLIKVRQEHLSWPAFVVRLVSELGSEHRTDTKGRVVCSLLGSNLHFFVPTYASATQRTLGKLERSSQEATASLSPVARSGSGAFVAELTRSVSLGDLKADVPDAQLDALLDGLAESEITTAGDVLDLEPEEVLARARASRKAREFATDADLIRAVDATISSAERLLGQTANAVVQYAEKRAEGPLVRSALSEKPFLTAVAAGTSTALRSKLSAATMKAVAGRVSGR